MKITKQGEKPDAPYEGECERCGCKFECRFDETERWGCINIVRICPGCGHGGFIKTTRVWAIFTEEA